jgi:ribonuclease Y
MQPLFIFLSILIGLVIGSIIGGAYIAYRPNSGLKKAQQEASHILESATDKADTLIKRASDEAKAKLKDTDVEVKEKKQELSAFENKLDQRESYLVRRDETLLSKEQSLESKHTLLDRQIEEIAKKEQDLQKKSESIDEVIASIAKMTQTEAKDLLMHKVEEKSNEEIGMFLRTREEELNEKSKELSQNILTLAVEKYSQEVASEHTVSVVNLPSDELKGRIIGREGRNIKTIEQLTGVDLIIDDTPEVITVSCYDPIRREIAKRSLEYLIKDGRIQPGRIEEIVEKTKLEMKELIKKIGEETTFELGVSKLPKEIVELIGRMHFRTSYGQNGLQHIKEVSHFCGIMAAELGLNQTLARRAGLLHDIGKAVDFEQEGSHVEIGTRIAKKFGESPIIINAIESHHGDVAPTSVYASLVIAADTLSAARPGARSETLENYIQRIEKIEEISKSFPGVANAFAIQAGREIRVMVSPDVINDNGIFKVAQDIKDKIEKEMTYPGQIKVTVIREVRASDIAK